MNYLVLYVLAGCGLILQSTVLNHLTVAGVKPDILLILAIFHAIFTGPKKGAWFGFSLGLLQDLYLGRFIGMNALAKGAASILTGWLARGAYQENLLVPIIFLFVGTFCSEFLYLLLGKMVSLQWTWSLWLWRSIPAAIYNACLVPFLYTRFFSWAAKDKEEQVL